ncbi:hypothetical protein C8R46DRAFT_236753 [Mycena filopes]|nr:hypothetical protein C8R46DRAFT_236753 [Mycena filopes]
MILIRSRSFVLPSCVISGALSVPQAGLGLLSESVWHLLRQTFRIISLCDSVSGTLPDLYAKDVKSSLVPNPATFLDSLERRPRPVLIFLNRWYTSLTPWPTPAYTLPSLRLESLA